MRNANSGDIADKNRMKLIQNILMIPDNGVFNREAVAGLNIATSSYGGDNTSPLIINSDNYLDKRLTSQQIRYENDPTKKWLMDKQ